MGEFLIVKYEKLSSSLELRRDSIKFDRLNAPHCNVFLRALRLLIS